MLGERRLCKLDVDCYGQGSVEVYCLEQESLQDGLQPVQVWKVGCERDVMRLLCELRVLRGKVGCHVRWGVM